MIFSHYQLDIFAAIADPAGGHLVVEALAGSGKTTTMVEGLSHAPTRSRKLVTTFTTAARDELQKKVPRGRGAKVQSSNSFGYGAIIKVDGEERKPEKFCETDRVRGWLSRHREFGSEQDFRKSIVALIDAAKQTLSHTYDELDATADRMEVEVKPLYRADAINAALAVMEECLEEKSGPISFTDQLWLPIVRKMPIPGYDFVFVDEVQDFNRCQIELVKRAVQGGRVIAVGDRHQAVYAWRGADPLAMTRIREELGAIELPLSVSYRCPKSVVAEAKKYVPAIEAAPGAPDGKVTQAHVSDLRSSARPGDFVVSRTNAPLISLAFYWLSKGQRCAIIGRNEFAKGLKVWIENSDARSINELCTYTEVWRDQEVGRLEELDRDTSYVKDRAACVLMLARQCQSIGAMLLKVDELFNDSGEPGILLTSTHRAKGLEANRVWLLRDTYAPEAGGEEANLIYVGITRSKDTLIYTYGAADEHR
jgi:hypothetical protein